MKRIFPIILLFPALLLTYEKVFPLQDEQFRDICYFENYCIDLIGIIKIFKVLVHVNFMMLLAIGIIASEDYSFTKVPGTVRVNQRFSVMV